MIHSARRTVPPVAITILAWTLFCFARFWKLLTDGRTTLAKMVITTGRDCGSATWIYVYAASVEQREHFVKFITKFGFCFLLFFYLNNSHSLDWNMLNRSSYTGVVYWDWLKANLQSQSISVAFHLKKKLFTFSLTELVKRRFSKISLGIKSFVIGIDYHRFNSFRSKKSREIYKNICVIHTLMFSSEVKTSLANLRWSTRP